MNTRKVRVLVVDDSAIVRKVLSETLAAEPDIDVVGTAPDPVVAARKISTLHPDVLTLDIEMPKQDGLSFLKELMRSAPMPVIMLSSLAQSGCMAAVQALEFGAVDVLAKPGGPYSVGDLRLVLAAKVRAAAAAKVVRPKIAAVPTACPKIRTPQFTLPTTRMPVDVIAIGASTGGTEAIRQVLEKLPTDLPPLVIVQHIPPVFSKAFADRLNQLCGLEVREARDGDKAVPGTALIAPGDRHMVIRRTASGLIVELKGGPRVCYQRPSVDVLFNSVAQAARDRAIGVILTGMGNDGAVGMLHMRQAGAETFGQDEATCVVYGMPREAEKQGAVGHVLPLEQIAGALSKAARPQCARV